MANSKYFIKFDVEALNNALSIVDVLSRYASPITNVRKPIHCPDPDHIDKHPSTTIYPHSNSCYCFSCNQNFTPVGVARANMKGHSFKDVCEQLCADFGLDPYRFSNKAEVEAMMGARKAGIQKFIEAFPLDKTDLYAIGVDVAESKQYPLKKKIKEEEFDRLVYGDAYVEDIKKKIPDAYLDKDKNPVIISMTYGEFYAEITHQNLMEYDDEGHSHRIENFPNEILVKSVRMQWEEAVRDGDKEARDGLEEMLKGMAYNAIEKCNEVIETNQTFLNSLKSVLPNNEAVMEARKWCIGYMKATMFDHITPILTPAQQEKINAYQQYAPCEQLIKEAKTGIRQAEIALDKLEKYQDEREKAEKLEKKGFKYNR